MAVSLDTGSELLALGLPRDDVVSKTEDSRRRESTEPARAVTHRLQSRHNRRYGIRACSVARSDAYESRARDAGGAACSHACSRRFSVMVAKELVENRVHVANCALQCLPATAEVRLHEKLFIRR